jgi:hypothetical protein
MDSPSFLYEKVRCEAGGAGAIEPPNKGFADLTGGAGLGTDGENQTQLIEHGSDV